MQVAGALAIHGGPKAKPTPYHAPNKYGAAELDELRQAIESGRLMGPGGKVREFEEAVEQAYGVAYAAMVSSGTAALHTALAALGVAEGDEVITTPMTDMGTVCAVLALHAVPVFADIDLETCLISPRSARERITRRTKAVITVHMAGNVCDMEAFLALSRSAGVKVLEDASQAHGARFGGRFVGGIGHAAGFSMNESKQVCCGDGGYVTTHDAHTADRALLLRDKAYDRKTGWPRGQQPIAFFAPNYRATCLQAAVALCRLRELPRTVARRAEIVARYRQELADLPQLEFPRVFEGCEPSWWPLPVRYTGESPTRDEIAEALTAEGVSVTTGMSPASNIMRTELFRRKHYYPDTDRVPEFWRDTVYEADSCPNVDELQRTVLRLPVDERYTDEDIGQTVEAVLKVWQHMVS